MGATTLQACSRSFVKRAAQMARNMGYEARAFLEYVFFVFDDRTRPERRVTED